MGEGERYLSMTRDQWQEKMSDLLRRAAYMPPGSDEERRWMNRFDLHKDLYMRGPFVRRETLATEMPTRYMPTSLKYSGP